MTRYTLVALLVWWMGLSSAFAQIAPGTVVLDPAPAIPGVVAGGTRPEIVVRGLRASDDPIWLPNIGLIFNESSNNRVVRLGDDGHVTTFIGDLHGPLGMTLDRQGRLISLRTQAGSPIPR
jgi:sugar lactone lactonase YvrE